MAGLIHIDRLRGGPAFPLALPHPARVDAGLVEDLEVFARHGSGVGIGNLILDVASRRGNDQHPDDDILLLHHLLPQMVHHFFQIPLEVCERNGYDRPYLDRHVSAYDRDSWPRGHYVQLIVMAFAFGGTRENLFPAPHDTLARSFYRNFGREQRQCLEEAAAQHHKWAETHPALPAAPTPPSAPSPTSVPKVSESDIAEIISITLKLNGASHLDMIARAILARMGKAPDPSPVPPKTQEDLRKL
jgi:hypothetical protein